MEIICAIRGAPDAVNEDFLAVGERFAVVLDGATAEPGVDNGCVHSVRWLVTELGVRLFSGLTRDEGCRTPLPDLLAEAIRAVIATHGAACDLDNPRSPSATVVILRDLGERVEYALLGDSALAFERNSGEVTAVIDDRMARCPHRSWAELRHFRNVEGGFWVAGNRAEAAFHAVTGARPVRDLRRAALLTDGAYRLVERFGWSWRELFDLLVTAGPGAAIAQTRAAEEAAGPGCFPGKRYDDAAIALCGFPVPEPVTTLATSIGRAVR